MIAIFISCQWKLPFPVKLCRRLVEEPTTTIDHAELERSKIALPWDWSEDQINLLKLFCFAYFTFVLLKPPSCKSRIRFTYFLSTATQPWLSTQRIIHNVFGSHKGHFVDLSWHFKLVFANIHTICGSLWTPHQQTNVSIVL